MSKELFIAKISPEIIPILRELYWSGKLDIFLSKGYVTLNLTVNEQEKWQLNASKIDQIERILQ